MTLRALIDELQSIADHIGDDAEVRLATQPRWAFEYSIGAVALLDPTDGCEAGEDDEADDTQTAPVVYIGEGQQLGYLSGAASRELGWGR